MELLVDTNGLTTLPERKMEITDFFGSNFLKDPTTDLQSRFTELNSIHILVFSENRIFIHHYEKITSLYFYQMILTKYVLLAVLLFISATLSYNVTINIPFILHILENLTFLKLESLSKNFH